MGREYTLSSPHLPMTHSTSPLIADTDALLALVRAQFSVQATAVRHLSGERDLNFVVEVDTGAHAAPARYVPVSYTHLRAHETG
jgi:hypothetical protein